MAVFLQLVQFISQKLTASYFCDAQLLRQMSLKSDLDCSLWV